ncbi:Glu/Leu/Phe/Val dehydrogenase dimerization domain-containing protein [Coralliovum pocilloporae]|uniref:Glu/Leu/Phe/Val dehydrogenase dimerization domain-containing protein n=1 Tax=Coralliovum pocilloporae TaxID=3066369 RepID=UPI003306A8BC
MTAMPRTLALATPFDHVEFRGHEQIVFCRDEASGLSAIIAIHNTNLGPAVGGCRMWPYETHEAALTDALRLSRGMTYKNALAGLENGGGKAVIIGNPKTDKSPELFKAFGRHVQRLAGGYMTGEDVGITPEDMEQVATETPYALGILSNGLGDPSPYTAEGVFLGIKAAVRHRLGSDSLSGLSASVQGLGHVGYSVARHLHAAGVTLLVSDINPESTRRAREEFGATIIQPDEAHRADVDLFVPCALGGGLNKTTIPEIRAAIVAGAANNQLAHDEDGIRLMQRDILYAPDYAINAAGVISIVLARPDEPDTKVRAKMAGIDATLTEIFSRSQAEGQPTNVVADRLAEERFNRSL